MPHTYQPNDSKRPLPPPPTRENVGVPPDAVVFCNFNNVYKIYPDMFDICSALMPKIPDSVLWLLSVSTEANENLLREIERRGTARERLVFAPRIDLASHLGCFRLADLFLDTYPCTGHATASDALRCGVPVVTRIGDSFASRVAASLLHAQKLPQLVTHTPPEYYDLVHHLAKDRTAPSELKKHLEDVRSTCPLVRQRGLHQAPGGTPHGRISAFSESMTWAGSRKASSQTAKTCREPSISALGSWAMALQTRCRL
jgi:protein O-GlcNAc transferase